MKLLEKTLKSLGFSLVKFSGRNLRPNLNAQLGLDSLARPFEFTQPELHAALRDGQIGAVRVFTRDLTPLYDDYVSLSRKAEQTSGAIRLEKKVFSAWVEAKMAAAQIQEDAGLVVSQYSERNQVQLPPGLTTLKLVDYSGPTYDSVRGSQPSEGKVRIILFEPTIRFRQRVHNAIDQVWSFFK